jgi:hypothetical protein
MRATSESSVTKEGASLGALISGRDYANWKCEWRCEKWSEEAVDFVRRQLEAEGVSHIQDGNQEVNGVVVPIMIPISAGITSDYLRKYVGDPEEIIEIQGNLLLNAGIQRMEDNLIAVPASTAVFDNTHSRIGVGNSTTAEAATQTDLQAAAGSSNRQFKLQNASFPVRPGSNGNQSVDWRSDFTSGEANFAWQEWGIDNGTANSTTVSAPMLNRKVQSLGTKTTGTWTMTGTITIS